MNTTIIFPWGPFTISVFSLSFSAAILIALIAVIVAGMKERLPFQVIIDFILIGMVCGIIGGRVAHILIFNRNLYFRHPEQIVCLQDGGISFWGGFLLTLVVVMAWAVRRNHSLEPFLDVAAPALALGLSIGRIGYPWQGKIMSSFYPWGIVQEEQLAHPVGAYAIILLMLLYFYLLRCRRQVHYKGELMCIFIAGYGLINLVTDFFSDLPVVWGKITAGQLVSLVMVFLVIIYMIGGSKIYSSSYYFNRKIYIPPSSRLKPLFKLIWAILFIVGQLYLYFMVNGFPAGLVNILSW